jgi:hypothetical protein
LNNTAIPVFSSVNVFLCQATCSHSSSNAEKSITGDSQISAFVKVTEFVQLDPGAAARPLNCQPSSFQMPLIGTRFQDGQIHHLDKEGCSPRFVRRKEAKMIQYDTIIF